MFVEYQKGDDSRLADSMFYAASADDATWGHRQRQNGKIVRLWKYNSDKNVTVNFPATDYPYASWYWAYCKRIHTLYTGRAP